MRVPARLSRLRLKLDTLSAVVLRGRSLLRLVNPRQLWKPQDAGLVFQAVGISVSRFDRKATSHSVIHIITFKAFRLASRYAAIRGPRMADEDGDFRYLGGEHHVQMSGVCYEVNI